MKKTCLLFGLVPATLVPIGLVAAIEIKGKVIEVSKDTVQVQLDIGLVPNPGDKVEISFEIPDLKDRALVAEGKVAEVKGRLLTVKIDRSPGQVEKNHLASV